MTDLMDVKVGDSVFIVPQKQRWGQQQEGFTAVVSSVARKYAIAKTDGQWVREYCFHRNCGASKEAPDSNERANGYGFDVYHSEDEYRKAVQAANEKEELIRRLDRGFSVEIRRLPPEAVREIIAILDRCAERES
jgi:hypothetical protein